MEVWNVVEDCGTNWNTWLKKEIYSASVHGINGFAILGCQPCQGLSKSQKLGSFFVRKLMKFWLFDEARGHQSWHLA